MEEYLNNKDFNNSADLSCEATLVEDDSILVAEETNITAIENDDSFVEETIPKYIAPKEILVERFLLKK